ncbi:competence protein ComFB [Selenomonas sp. GACV-9]|uniref:late competence development ComFB family protein n=1 Tax=Selenomonas sp. GACV-9 TaxID=3158782 RepID=UPI0008F1ED40|nr:competence protein ComFB [Selenomonas ruminantium]
MELKNCMEEFVQDKMDVVLEQYPDCCRCEQCRLDIAALALNQLPPRYVSTREGDVFVRVNEMNTECEVKVIKAIANAIEVVNKNPRHGVGA